MKVLSYLTMLFVFGSTSPEPTTPKPGIEPKKADSTQMHSIMLIEDCVIMESKRVCYFKSC